MKSNNPADTELHEDVLLRPTPNDMAIAPELGVLAVLDATLATAAYQLLSENPDLTSLILAAKGELPPPPARKANILLSDIHSLRMELRKYYAIVTGDYDDGEIDF